MSSTVSRFSITLLSAQLFFGSFSALSPPPAQRPDSDPITEASILFRKGSLPEALSKYEEARRLSQRDGDVVDLGRSFSGIGDVYDLLGQEQKSIEAYNEALHFFTASAERKRQAEVLHKLALVYEEIGDPQKGVAYGSKALELVRNLGDTQSEATILGNVALLYKSIGETSKSLDYNNRALQLMKSARDRRGEARILNNLGSLHNSLGDRETALKFFNEALPIWRETKDLNGITSSLNNMGATYALLQKKDESIAAYNEALKASLAGSRFAGARFNPDFDSFCGPQPSAYESWVSQNRPVWNSKQAATTINNLGQAYSELGQKEKAIILFRQAASLSRLVGDRQGEASALENLAALYQLSGDEKTSSSLRGQAATLFDSLEAIKRSAGKPTLHILSIGNGRYPRGPRVVRPSLKYPLWNIPAAVKDARDLTQTLQSSARDFEDVKTHLLINATKAQILGSLDKIVSEIRPRDTFVFHYSGQGFSQVLPGTKKREFYIMPTDFSARVGARGAISTSVLLAFMTRIQAQRRFIVLDARESSSGFDRMSVSIGEERKMLEGLLQRDVALVTLSEGARINLVEGEGKNNGLLTYALLKGMGGPADLDGNGVSVREAIEYARSYVKQRLLEIPDLVLYQRQVEVKNFVAGEDFPLARRDVLGRGVSRAHASGLTRFAGVKSGAHPEARLFQDPTQSRGGEIIGLTDTAVSRAPRPRTGKDYALLIASDKYERWPPLNNPITDAKAVAKTLADNYGFEPELLPNPTKLQIFNAIKKYKNKKYAMDDQLFIFFAGHGTYYEDFRDGCIVASDSLKDDPAASTYFLHKNLRDLIDGIPSDHILLVIDACFGGTFDEWTSRNQHHAQYENATNAQFISDKMRIRTRWYITSGGKEYVEDGPAGEHSPFARRLLRALEIGGDDGILTVAEIKAFMQRLKPAPVINQWPGNDPRSEFLFIRKKK